MQSRATIRILSWNIQAIRGVSEARLARILGAIRSAKVDVLILQEVASQGDCRRMIERQLRSIGLDQCCFSNGNNREKKYGNLIASRFPVAASEWLSAPPAPWPQLLTRATIQMQSEPIEVIGIHIPNGSQNGWKKIETYEALRSVVESPCDVPRIVAGDFNEPRKVLPNNEIVTFGAHRKSDSLDGLKEEDIGGTHPRRRWHDAVSYVIGPDNRHFQHAWLSLHPGEAVPTHVIRGTERFFDHILVSHHFKLLDAGYNHTWRLKEFSDHSAAWADVQLRSARGR